VLNVSQCLVQDGSVRLSLTVTKIETDGDGLTRRKTLSAVDLGRRQKLQLLYV